jgi:predicted  nucleic acid-binding Zn-ribbon protein
MRRSPRRLKVELDTARPALAHARAELERVRAQLARSQGAERQLQQQQQQAAASSGGMGVAEEAALRAELEALRLALLEARAELARSASEWASKEEEWRLVSLKRYAQSSHADERLKLLAKSEAHLKRRLDMMQLAMHAVERSLDPERAAKIRAQIAERETQLEAQFALKSVHTLALKRETFADTVGQQMRAIDSKLQRLASCSPTPSAGAPSGTTLPRLSSNN